MLRSKYTMIRDTPNTYQTQRIGSERPTVRYADRYDAYVQKIKVFVRNDFSIELTLKNTSHVTKCSKCNKVVDLVKKIIKKIKKTI